MLVLGIESSCDECAAAVVSDGSRLLGQQVASQIPIHAPFGGVVPELASRDHIRRIIGVLEASLERSNVSLKQLDGIAVTSGPGLIGSLLVGLTAAKTLAFAYSKPLVGVNHIEAHLRAVYLDHELEYPHIGLVASGGHTSLFRVDGIGKLRLLGRTLDDAAGEAFDKVAKLLGLDYPGGISIQREAQRGDPGAIHFPRPLPGKRMDFSFSGLKTSACVRVKREGWPSGQALCDFAASFQEAVVDTLVRKTLLAARLENLATVLVAGGVAANLRLRQVMIERAAADGVDVCFPAVELCTDNAAMVAALGSSYLAMGREDGADLDADARLAWPAA
jgi:N6-L-threonylcarbamoyladenine synthase